MRNLLRITAFLWVCMGYGQDQEPVPPSSSAKDSAQQVMAADPVKDFQEVSLIPSQKPDSLVLVDHPYAARFDSLWIKELRTISQNFTEMYQEVQRAGADSLSGDPLTIDTETLKERLLLLDERTPFNISYNPSLEGVIKYFLTNKRELMERMLSSSQYYFPLFEQVLDQHNLPLELKYLAIVESALDPRAKSRVGATGLWQFMYSTGRIYKLDVSSYVDERSDPVRATDAASRYLDKLHEIFEDWDLALAAYNSGPGNVNKAIRRSGGYKNYWALRPFLPRETAGYVPAFLATMYLFEYAEEHGLKPAGGYNPYFETDTVLVQSTITFDQISRFTGVPLEEINILNPSYKLGIIPKISGKEYTLRLPRIPLGAFVSNEKAIYAKVEQEIAQRKKALPEYVKAEDRIRYRVRSGDYLGKIAERYGVSVRQIKQWNGLRSNNLRIGQRLTIYPRKPVTSSRKKTSGAGSTPGTKEGAARFHVVERGDSLWAISKKYQGVSVDKLREWNGIRGNNLQPGTKLKLCNCSP